MRIFMIGEKCIPGVQGGVERHVEELAKNLVERGNDVYVYCRSRYTQEKLPEYKGIHLIYLPTIYTKHLEAITHTLLATLNVLFKKADVVHYHGIGPSSLLWIVKLFKPNTLVVATHHCQDYKHQKWGIIAKLYLQFGEWVACRFADRVIAVSQTLQSYIKDVYNRDAIFIPNGAENVDKMYSKEDVLEKYGLKEGEYYVAISRLVKHKGLHYLVDAFSQIKTDKKLVIVGGSAYTDDYKDWLINKAKANLSIVFTGEQGRDAVAELLRKSYCFVQPSEAEGLSVALLEAVLAGKPCIVSDISENIDVVGVNALAFASKSVEDLAKQLQYAELHPKELAVLGKKAKEEVADKYDWKNVAGQIEAVYESAT